MRVAVILGCCGALALGACGSAKDVVTTDPTSSTTATTAPAPTTTVPTSATTAPTCPPVTAPVTPVTSAPTTVASMLTNVHEAGDSCLDNVIFDFTAAGTASPGYTVTYGTPPFVTDASGAPVSVAGSAFVVVKVKPGYGYDFVAGKPTYTGPRSVPVANANHVRAIVETGDFEGVLTWVIGLDAKRSFRVTATGTPSHQLTVTVG